MSRPMRIAVWHNLPSGGGKRCLFDQVKYLVAQGHHVEVWCPPTADRSFLPIDSFAPEHVRPLVRPPRPKHPRHVYRWMSAQLSAMDVHCRACADEINRGEFDVLLAHPCTFFRPVGIARHVRIPSVLYLPEPYRWLYAAMPTPPFMMLAPRRTYGRNPSRYLRVFWRDLFETQAKRLQVRAEFESAKAFDRILVNSFFSRESVLRAYGLDSKVCYLGIDTALFVDQRRTREPVVLGIGAFVAEKNIHFVIEAVARMSTKVRLVWVGNVADEHYRDRLVQLAADRGVAFEPRMRIPDRDVVSLLNSAAVMAYAPRLEPFGYAPVEASSCGLPVVAVAEAGVRETVVDGVNGFLIEDADPDRMAAALDRVVSSPELASALAAGGKRLVEERWTLDAAGRRLEHHLQQVIGRPEAALV